MRNILKRNNQPEFTTAMRAEMIADVDAENREHERREYEFAKDRMGSLATNQNVIVASEDSAEKV